MNYQSTFTLTPLPGATGTWGFNATLLPHPIDFMAVENFDDTHVSPATSGLTNFMNTQLAGVTHTEKFEAFAGMVQRWRLAYMSVTVYQDGPDLANQGTIVCAQPPVKPRLVGFSFLSTTNLQALYPTEYYTAEDKPNFDVLQAEPNAYFGKSKEGAYVPLKLTDTCQDWMSESDCVTIGAVTTPTSSTGQVALGSGSDDVPYYPHYSLTAARVLVSTHEATACYGSRTSPMLNGTFAHICGRNLGLTTSFAFFVRCGVEMQVSPSSILSPQLKLAPPQDPLALETYFTISRELKDAYPADYNDLGKIWDAISPVAKKVSKILSKVPGARLLGTALDVGTDIGDWARNAGKGRSQRRRKPKSKPSAAASTAAKGAYVGPVPKPTFTSRGEAASRRARNKKK